MNNEKNICELELIVNNPMIKKKISELEVSVYLDDNKKIKKRIGKIDLINDKFILYEDENNESDITKNSRLVDALMRATMIKPNIKKFRKQISHWDDIILGLDTNVFYTGIVTSCILDEFVKIPSGDFIDSPDWITLVLSKVAMGEIENRANIGKDSAQRRQALRAIQEIMLIGKSKDLEGVSLFLAGNIPPEIQFSDGGKNTVRDSVIRDQFRVFLKNLDFHKGSYFLTQDFNNSVLAEAEGLMSLYIKKPKITTYEFDISSNDFSISEFLYELAVSFNPILLEGNGTEIQIESNWQGKTLEDWESWTIKLEWLKDSSGIKEDIDIWLNKDLAIKIKEGWKKLDKRYVSWMEFEQ